jgi:co-chaperonin GroES (HSP10)
MKPIGKYIAIKSIEEEIKTESGILLSADDAESMRYKHGKVIKAGTEVANIHDGDEIYYEKRNSFTMLINDEQFTIIREADVVVVL